MNALLITDHKETEPILTKVLKNHNITIEKSYDCLNSLRSIRTSLKDTGNTVFIRKSFSRLIQNSGTPDIIILDYKIDLGLDAKNDPDHMKLLRTFFISYIILLKKEEMNNIHANFIIIAEKKQIDQVKKLEQHPIILLNLLKTDNADINNIIEHLKGTPDKINELFSIIPLPADATLEEIDACISKISQKKADVESPPTVNQPIELPQGNVKPAAVIIPQKPVQVIFRTSNESIYINNNRVDSEKNPAYNDFALTEFYIVGAWVSKNQQEVAEIIKIGIRNGIGKKKFDINDEIIVNILNCCEIDATTLPSMVILFLQDLAQYKNIKIRTNFKNANILEKSSGYSMIKSYFRHSY